MKKFGKLMRPDFTPVPPLTAKQKEAAFLHWGRRCTFKGCQTTHGLDIDHVIPRGLGGTNDLNNTRPMCEEHHKAKTHGQGGDRAKINKATRVNKKQFARNELPPKKSIPGRGFQKGHRPLKGRSSWR